jgi:hypothetical protein
MIPPMYPALQACSHPTVSCVATAFVCSIKPGAQARKGIVNIVLKKNAF